MPPNLVHLLTISGSLRLSSSNTALMGAARILAPGSIRVVPFTQIADLPHFNPDLERETPLPISVIELRRRVARADGILISCPEYARGVPGAFKNALDWLVGSPSDDKHIALWNASPRAHHAQDALRLILSTMLGEVVEAACIDIPLLGANMTAAEIAANAKYSSTILSALSEFSQIIQQS